MKKIYNILALSGLAVIAALSSCRPLDKTFDGLGPKPTATIVAPTIASITLAAADYAKLPPSNPANSQMFFHGTTDAFAGIPSILSKNYPTAGDKSQITVTYATSPAVPAYFKSADSTYTKITYTLTNADYTLLPGNTYLDFSASQILAWLPYKYPSPVDHQQVILTFTYYDGATYTATQAFLYFNGAWKKAYLVSPAQYASVNRTSNAFVSADNDIPNILTSYFNTFLKTDPTIVATAKIGDVQYVSYKYSSYQRVLPMAFDGTNWVSANTTATNLFTLTNGTWTGQLDNTVSYTLSTADYTTIAGVAANAPISASANAVTDLTSHKDFTLNGANRWTDLQIANGLIVILKANFAATAAVNQKFLVTFKSYSQYANETYTFNFDGTNFVYVPVPDNSKYQLTGDDYDAVSKLTTTGATSAATGNLASYGNFSMSGGTAWTQGQINIGVAAVLKTRYPNATANQIVAVTYAYYNGSNKLANAPFKFDGTNWVAQ